MKRFESRQVQIKRPAGMIYGVLSDFTNFTPIVADKVEDWQATPDTCSFKAKGFGMALRIVEKEPDKLVKITADEGAPLDFTFWLQLVGVSPEDTRMRIVLDAKLNAMMNMMIGGKLQEGVDTIAEKIAESFNTAAV